MKRLISGVVVTTAAMLGLGMTNGPAHAVENSWQAAFGKCESGSPKAYVVGAVEKKSFKGGPKIGTLYIVRMRTDVAHRTRYCAVTIKGGTTAGNHHDMHIEIFNDSLNVDSGGGFRKEFVGPVYTGSGDWVIARSSIQLGDIRKEVEITL